MFWPAIAIAASIIVCTHAFAQSTIEETGRCSANVIGDNNTTIVVCPQAKKKDEILVVLEHDENGYVGLDGFGDYWKVFLFRDESTFQVGIDQQKYEISLPKGSFAGAHYRFSVGSHPFTMMFKAVTRGLKEDEGASYFLGGKFGEMTRYYKCAGILKIETDAVLIPKMVLYTPSDAVLFEDTVVGECYFEIFQQ